MSQKSQIIDADIRVKLEASAYRRLVKHLSERTDVQNIDMMNLAGFCRNCLANWYKDAARDEGIELDKNQAREIVYGMPFDQWRERYQTDATTEQKAAFERRKPSDH